jgi:hypothetical protein
MNGNRRDGIAAGYSVSNEFPEGTENIRQPDIAQGISASNSLAGHVARIRAKRNGGVDTKSCSCAHFGNDGNVDTKHHAGATFGNDAGVGFIRVRKRKLKTLATSSASFDLVRAVRVGGRPRHEFVLGFGSQKDSDRDHDLCRFWKRAIHRMVKRGLAEDRRSRLIAEMVRKGARLPTIPTCEEHVRFWPGWNQSAIEEIMAWLRDAEATPPEPDLPDSLRIAAS